MADRDRMVRGLVALAAADGRVGRREERLLRTVCELWGVAFEVLDDALDEARTGARPTLTVPREAEARHDLLRALVLVGTVTGSLGDEQREMLEAVAERIGVERFVLEARVDEALRRRAEERARARSTRPAPGRPGPRRPPPRRPPPGRTLDVRVEPREPDRG